MEENYKKATLRRGIAEVHDVQHVAGQGGQCDWRFDCWARRPVFWPNEAWRVQTTDDAGSVASDFKLDFIRDINVSFSFV